MEIIEVVGLRDVDFVDDKGREVKGTSVYYLIQAEGVNGKMSGKLFVSAERKSTLKVFPKPGDVVAVSYDRYGKPSEFKPV